MDFYSQGYVCMAQNEPHAWPNAALHYASSFDICGVLEARYVCTSFSGGNGLVSFVDGDKHDHNHALEQTERLGTSHEQDLEYVPENPTQNFKAFGKTLSKTTTSRA